jgi:hypothetical protein
LDAEQYLIMLVLSANCVDLSAHEAARDRGLGADDRIFICGVAAADRIVGHRSLLVVALVSVASRLWA